MDEKEFMAAADECLGRVAGWLEEFDPDELDYTLADGSVTIEFKDGAKFIISRQSATRQVWLAAGSRGFHFNFDAGSKGWRDDKDGGELFAVLAEVIGDHLGRPVEFEG